MNRHHRRPLPCAALLATLVTTSVHAVAPPAAALAPVAPPGDAPWTGLSRVFLTFRPYVGIARVGFEETGPVLGGFVSEAGAEIITRFGLAIGAQVSPISLAKRPAYTDLTTDAYLLLGYANQHLGVHMGVGSGVAGVLRIGRHDRSHAQLRVAWALVLPLTLPQELNLQVNIRAAPRFFGSIDIGGGYASTISFYALGGVRYLLQGDGLARTTLLSAGLGLSWIQFYLGPIAALAIERRF